MERIPWCVVMMMINDVGRMRKKKDTEQENIIQTEEEELEFLGLK